MKQKLVIFAWIIVASIVVFSLSSMGMVLFEEGHTIAVEQDAVLFVDWIQHVSVFAFYLYLWLTVLAANFISAVLFH